MTFFCGSTSKYFIHINVFGSTLNLGQDTCIKHCGSGNEKPDIKTSTGHMCK